MQAQILFRNNSSDANKEVIAFLHSKIQNLVQRGVRFTFRIINEDEIPQLLDKGIDKLPIMLVDRTRIIGSIKITSYLSKYLGGGIKASEKSKDPQDEVREWMSNEMTMEAKERDDKEENTNAKQMEFAKQKATDVMHQRQQGDVKNKKPDNIKPNVQKDIIQAVERGDKDDEMIAKMFEETE